MQTSTGPFGGFLPERFPGDTSGSRATRPSPAVRVPPRLVFLALFACALWLGVAACSRPQPIAGVIVTERLRSPFDVAERRALFGRSIDRFDCPQSLPPVRDVLVEGFYTDKDASVVNRQAMVRYREAIKPITDYESQIAVISDTVVRSSPPNPATARCALAGSTRRGPRCGPGRSRRSPPPT